MLITREKDIYDGAAPSGNSVTALNCLRLGRMTGNTAWEEKADRIFKTFSAQVAGYPMAYTQFLNAVDFILGPSQEIVITEASPGTATQEMIDLIHRAFLPRKVLLRRPEDRSSQEIIKLAPYTERMISVNQRPTVYVCENYSCRTPITDLETLSLTLIGKLPAEE
jgi:uncharacterized protein YyaL (SSP411 family)